MEVVAVKNAGTVSLSLLVPAYLELSHQHSPPPMNATNTTHAGTASLSLLVAGLLLGLAGNPLAAQCTERSCRSSPHPAVVRVVSITGDGSRSYGTGTLIEKNATHGVVISCSHVVDGRDAKVCVSFPDGRSYSVNRVTLDPTWDLAALEIAAPTAEPVRLADGAPSPGDWLSQCGYGPDGRYVCRAGRALGYHRVGKTNAYETLSLTGAAREGDSGGPVLDRQGRLVAVVWGTDGRTVEATYCGPVRRLLARLRERLEGGYPRGRLTPLQPTPPAPASPGPSTDNALASHLKTIRERLEGIGSSQERSAQEYTSRQERVDSRFLRIEHVLETLGQLDDRVAQPETTPGAASTAIPGLLATVLPAVLTALGWTTPPSIAAIVALRLGVALMRRRGERKRRSRQTAPPDPDPPPSNPDQAAPSGLNDDYAEQLARVYALSGRSPLGDVTLGREYDEALREAEESSDANLAAWARKLRDRVARRFHRIHGSSPMPAEPTDL